MLEVHAGLQPLTAPSRSLGKRHRDFATLNGGATDHGPLASGLATEFCEIGEICGSICLPSPVRPSPLCYLCYLLCPRSAYSGYSAVKNHGWKFYMLPLHIETYESLLALAKARQIEPGEFGGKTIPAPIRVVHGIVLQYLEDHKEEVESAEFNAAYESLGIGATSRRAKKASSDKQDSKVVN